MIRYCLKYKDQLWPAYIGETILEVKDQVWSGIGLDWSKLRRKDKGYRIVRVAIKEVK